MRDELTLSRPIGVDLFAGAGGMSLGFEQAGFDVLAAVELDPVHCATYEFNFPFWSMFCASVSNLTGLDIRRSSDIRDRDIDIVFGGPPCQGFSMIGKRVLDDPRNMLMRHFLRLVLELAPKYFVMENVQGLTVGKHRHFLQEVIDEFVENGYRVAQPYRVLNAADYGVPQDRRRVFLLGCRSDQQLSDYPEPSHWPVGSRRTRSLLLPELAGGPSVWDAMCDLPRVEDYDELFDRDWVQTHFGEPSDYGRRLRGLARSDDDYSYERMTDSATLTSSTRTVHTEVSIRRFATTTHGATEPVSRFRKLDPNGLCNTLRAGTASNRGAFTSPRPIHPFEPRCITVREAARLHSYPDWFRFHVTKWHGFRQVGNSVPPLLAQSVAREVMTALGVQPLRPSQRTPLGEVELLSFDMTQSAKRYGVSQHVIEPRTRREAEVPACV